MGYLLKTPLSNGQKRSPPFSRVGPKTLTPALPLQDRGHRFNNPEVGRWINRDPMGDFASYVNYSHAKNTRVRKILFRQQFYPVYLFVNNSPFFYIDDTGLYGNPVSGPDGPVAPGDP